MVEIFASKKYGQILKWFKCDSKSFRFRYTFNSNKYNSKFRLNILAF